MSSYRLFFILGRLLVVSSLAAGCGAEVATDPDGGDPDAATGDNARRQLEYLGPVPLQVRFGEEAELRFRYFDQVTNEAGEQEVSFALEGMAGDSSLSQLWATPVDGEVSTTLRGGTIQAATFRVRASASDAANAYVEVSVSDAGFGSIAATALYAGQRSLGSVELVLYTGAECSTLDPHEPPTADRIVVTRKPGVGRWTGSFEGLAVGPTYAVLARGRGEGDGVVASGCLPGIEVLPYPPGPASEASITLTDLTYGASGRFDLVSHFDLAQSIPGLVQGWTAPADALLAESGGTAPLVMQGISRYLSANDEASYASIEEQREGLESQLAARLGERGADVASMIESLRADLSAALSTPTLVSLLSLDRSDDYQANDRLRFSHESLELRFPLVVGDTALGERSVTFGHAGVLSVSSGEASLTTNRLTVEAHSLPFLLGTLAKAIVDDVLVSAYGADSLDGWFATMLDCADVGDWLASQVESACDAECYRSGCLEATRNLSDAVHQGLQNGDADVSALNLEGGASVSDANGDANTDALSEGRWTASFLGAVEIATESTFEGNRRGIE